MDQGTVSLIIACVTVVAGFVALRSKVDASVVADLKAYADRLEKSIDALFQRERDLLVRIGALEAEVVDGRERERRLQDRVSQLVTEAARVLAVHAANNHHEVVGKIDALASGIASVSTAEGVAHG